MHRRVRQDGGGWKWPNMPELPRAVAHPWYSEHMQTGYQTGFLGPSVNLPTSESPTVALDYIHYSVVFRTDRRLASVSAVNIDGSRLLEIERKKDIWLLDSRVP